MVESGPNVLAERESGHVTSRRFGACYIPSVWGMLLPIGSGHVTSRRFGACYFPSVRGVSSSQFTQESKLHSDCSISHNSPSKCRHTTRASHFYMYSVDGPRSSSILRKSLALWILAALLALAVGDAGSSGFLCRRSLLEALSIQSSGEAV